MSEYLSDSEESLSNNRWLAEQVHSRAAELLAASNSEEAVISFEEGITLPADPVEAFQTIADTITGATVEAQADHQERLDIASIKIDTLALLASAQVRYISNSYPYHTQGLPCLPSSARSDSLLVVNQEDRSIRVQQLIIEGEGLVILSTAITFTDLFLVRRVHVDSLNGQLFNQGDRTMARKDELLQKTTELFHETVHMRQAMDLLLGSVEPEDILSFINDIWVDFEGSEHEEVIVLLLEELRKRCLAVHQAKEARREFAELKFNTLSDILAYLRQLE